MEMLRTWALSVALAALAGGVVRLLAPKGAVEKSVRVVVAVFLLSAFLAPVVTRGGATLDWVFPQLQVPPANHALQHEMARQMQGAIEVELRNRMRHVLDTRGLDGQITLGTSILSDGSIDIVLARVEIPPGGNTTGLAAALRHETGFEVEIVWQS